jgi:hypothetical protein
MTERCFLITASLDNRTGAQAAVVIAANSHEAVGRFIANLPEHIKIDATTITISALDHVVPGPTERGDLSPYSAELRRQGRI